MTFLNELNADIIETNKNLNELKDSISVSLQESKKWTIVSRLLSGTGLWSVQNRMRALVSIVAEYQKGQQKQLETSQKASELMNKLAERTENLKLANEAFSNSIGHNSENLEQYIETVKKTIREQELLAATHELSSDEYKNAQKSLSVLNEILTDNSELLEQSGKAMKERERLMAHYGIDEEGANLIIKDRLELMEKTAKEQDNLLRGSEKYRQMEGKFLVEQVKRKTRIKEIDEAIAAEQAKRAEPRFRGDSVTLNLSKDREKQLELEKRKIKAQERVAKFTMMRQRIFDKLKNVGTFIKTVLSAAKTFLIYGFFIAIGLAVLFRVVKDAWPVIQNLYAGFMELWEWVTEYTGTFMDVFAEIWGGLSSIITGIYEGDFVKVIKDGFLPVLLGLVKLTIKLALVGIGALLLTVYALGIHVFQSYFDLFWGVITGDFEKVKASLGKIGAIIMAVAVMVAIVQALVMGIAVTWAPIALAMAAGAGMMYASGAFAKGGVTPNSGTFLVGEQGPELVSLPGNSRVYNNGQTNGMMGNTINVNVEGRVGASDQEIRQIARKVGEQINRELNRTTSTRVRM